MWSTLPSRRPRTIVALFAAIAAVGVVGAARVQNEDDLLVFLPRNDPDVQTPAQVSREIGPVGLVAVALIACGFFVMALGRSHITRLFGTPAGISTVLSAALTCVVLPMVLRVWRGPPRRRAHM